MINDFFEKYLGIPRQVTGYTKDEMFFLLWQIVAKRFREGTKNDKSYAFEKAEAYKVILDEYLKGFELPVERIISRNDNFVIIIIDQFLGGAHAPSVLALSTAEYLNKNGKRVLLVNTAELCGGKCPCEYENEILVPSYAVEYINKYSIEYKGVLYNFFQFPKGMPNDEGIKAFLEFITNDPPAYILNIDGMSVLTDIASYYVPVLCMNTSNEAALSAADAQFFGSVATKNDIEVLKIFGRKKDDIIPGKYIYNIPRKKGNVLRSELGIDDESFIMVIVGNRLDTELSDGFIDIISDILSDDIRVLFVGRFENYTSICSKNEKIGNYSYQLDFQDDLRAVISLSNLFVNPPRYGGGTSAVMAMLEGVPVVSLNYGDVSVAIGNEFCVADMERMRTEIIAYITDMGKWSFASQVLYDRAREMTDLNRHFSELFSMFEHKYIGELKK